MKDLEIVDKKEVENIVDELSYLSNNLIPKIQKIKDGVFVDKTTRILHYINTLFMIVIAIIVIITATSYFNFKEKMYSVVESSETSIYLYKKETKKIKREYSLKVKKLIEMSDALKKRYPDDEIWNEK